MNIAPANLLTLPHDGPAMTGAPVQIVSGAFRLRLSALLSTRKPGDPLPTRLQIFKLGENESNQGKFIVDDSAIRNLSAIQRQLGRERIPMGFEHNIDEGSEEYNRTNEPRPIAAKFTVEGVPGQGIFLSAGDWTTQGADNIENYEDLSPRPIFDKTTRRVLGILSVSLTRAGSIYGLTLDNAISAKLSANFSLQPEPKDNPMNATISPHRARIAQLAASGRAPINPETNRAFTSEELDRLPDQTLKMLAAQLSMQPARPVASARLSAMPNVPLNPYSCRRYTDNDLAKYPDPVASFLLKNMPMRVVTLSAGSEFESKTAQSAASHNKIVAANKIDNLRALLVKLDQQGMVPINPETDQPYSIDDLDTEGGKYPVEVLYHLVTNMPVARNSESENAQLSAASASSDNGLRGMDRIAAANQRENDNRGFSTNGRVGGYAMGFRPQ